MALLTPPGQSPDEVNHAARAAGLLHGAVLGVRKPYIDTITGAEAWRTGVKADYGIAVAGVGHTVRIENRPVVTEKALRAEVHSPVDHQRVYLYMPNTATYFPAAYLPATLGMAVALAFNAQPYACFMTARVFSLFAYLCIGAFALWIAAYGEAMLLTVLLLPMALFLGSTLNEDGLLTAMTCLACAALTRETRGYRILGLVFFALVLGAKPPYLLLIGAFLLPIANGKLFWERARMVALALVPVGVWIAIILAFVVVAYDRIVPYHPGPLYQGPVTVMDHANSRLNLSILLADPRRMITIPLSTIYWEGVSFIYGMIGILGLSQIGFHVGYYAAWLFCLGISLLGLFAAPAPLYEPPFRGADVASCFIMIFLIIATCWVVMITFYIDWTVVGSQYVEGIQGRYLLILLPFLIFAIPSLRTRFAVPPLLPAIPTIIMGLYDIAYLPL